MTDFLAFPIWFVLSWLIRQIQNGVDEEPDEAGNETASEGPTPEEIVNAELASEQYEPIVQVIKIGIAAFSLLLLGLSLSAYRKTGLRRILYASVAFGLFAVQMFYEYLEDAVEGFETPYGDVIFSAITLAILALFFAAIVRRK